MKNKRSPANQNPEACASLLSVVVFGGRDETDLLGITASLACAAEHPLGSAILGSGDHGLKLRPVERLQVISDRGVTGVVDGHDVIIGNAAFLTTRGLSPQYLTDWADRFAQQGQEITLVAVDTAIVGLFGIAVRTAELSRYPAPLNGGKK